MAKLVRVETADGHYRQIDLETCRPRGRRNRFYYQIAIYQTSDGRFLKLKYNDDIVVFYCIELDIRHAATLLKRWGFHDPVERRLRTLQSKVEANCKAEKPERKAITPSEGEPTEDDAVESQVRLGSKVSECEASILKVLKDAETSMIGRTIAQLAGKTYNSHFRSMLKRLEVRGELRKPRGTRGFILSSKISMS